MVSGIRLPSSPFIMPHLTILFIALLNGIQSIIFPYIFFHISPWTASMPSLLQLHEKLLNDEIILCSFSTCSSILLMVFIPGNWLLFHVELPWFPPILGLVSPTSAFGAVMFELIDWALYCSLIELRLDCLSISSSKILIIGVGRAAWYLRVSLSYIFGGALRCFKFGMKALICS